MTETTEDARETVVEKPNGDLHVTDALGRTATLHWSRFHGLIVSSDHVAVYLGQPETRAWLASRVSTPPPPASSEEWEYAAGYVSNNGFGLRWFALSDWYVVREVAEREVARYVEDEQVQLIRRPRPAVAEPVPAVPVTPTEPAEER